MPVNPELNRRLFNLALAAPDDLAVQVTYLDMAKTLTRRIVSPIRYLTRDRILVYCLSRGEPRALYVQRCVKVALVLANEVMAPVELGEVTRGKEAAGAGGDGVQWVED